jgi:hypothetical protein
MCNGRNITDGRRRILYFTVFCCVVLRILFSSFKRGSHKAVVAPGTVGGALRFKTSDTQRLDIP